MFKIINAMTVRERFSCAYHFALGGFVALSMSRHWFDPEKVMLWWIVSATVISVLYMIYIFRNVREESGEDGTG